MLQNMLKSIMISCEKATELVAKKEVTKLSIKEKIGIKLHLFHCYLCRRYYNQLQIISNHISKLNKKIKGSTFFFTLNTSQKSKLQEVIKNKIN